MKEWLRRWRKDIGLARAGYTQLNVWYVGCWTCQFRYNLRAWFLKTFFYVPPFVCETCRREMAPPSWVAQAYEGENKPLARCLNHRCSQYGLHFPRG